MTGAIRLTLADAELLARAALRASGAASNAADTTARALVAAEADGQSGHGLSRVPSYAAQLRAGKIVGDALPRIERVAPAALRIDGGLGFAYPAIDAAIGALAPLATENGIAVAAIARSHHFGQAGAHVERLAARGLIALLFGNSPKAMSFWGGKAPAMGTNPIAFAAPLRAQPPLVIDLALSTAARGKVLAAQQTGRSIPEGWALDCDGAPTTDPTAALAGSMVAIGGAKGAALALMVEILAAALTGSSFGFEASSLLDDQGDAPDLGHCILALDPMRLSGRAFLDRMDVLLEAMQAEPGVRMPGQRRLQARERAAQDGIELDAALHRQIRTLAEAPHG
jgi:(2R)-3-sulfolactate dehydrogenase (NADP+)